MARDFRSPIDLHLNELRNALIHLLGSDPGSAVEGQIYYNTTTHVFKFYSGTAWIVLGSLDQITKAAADVDINSHKLTNVTNPTSAQDAATRGYVLGLTPNELTPLAADYSVNTHKLTNVVDPTSAQHAATKNYVDTQTLNGIATRTATTADVDINSHKLINVTDPSAAQDAATKNYVDSQTAGARDVKDSVRVVTNAALPAYTRTANVITASANGALAAVDGVTLVANDSLLLKNGAAGADNGIYTVTQVGTGGTPFILTRRTDADASTEMTAGVFVWATEGTVNADTGWLLTTDDPITLNTTALTFTQVSALGQIVAGNGLTKTGAQLDVGAGTGITVAADTVGIDTSVVSQRQAFTIGDGSTTSIVVTHSLPAGKDHSVTVFDLTTPFAEQYPEVRHTSATTDTLIFSVAPTTNQYRAILVG